MAELIVSFACNDYRNGEFQGECNAVQVEDEGDVVIGFDILDVPMKWDGNVVILADASFAVNGRARWVGNWCWDQTRMLEEDVVRLVKWLIENVGRPVEYQPEHRIGQLAVMRGIASAEEVHAG